MSATEVQLTQTEVPRPQGWNDEDYEQLVEFIAYVRDLEALGGSKGLLALVSGPETNKVAVADSTLSWAKGTGFKADVWSDGWFKRTIHVKITTDDGHNTSFTVSSALGALIWGTKTVTGQLGFNDWSALKAGTNNVTINSNGLAPVKVNGTLQGEFKASVPSGVPSFSLDASFSWN